MTLVLRQEKPGVTTIYSCTFWPRGKSLISTNAWVCSDLFRNLIFCIYCLERKSCLFINKANKFVRNFNQSPQILILKGLLNHQGTPLFSERASWLSLQKLGDKASSSLYDPLASVNKKATLPCTNYQPPNLAFLKTLIFQEKSKDKMDSNWVTWILVSACCPEVSINSSHFHSHKCPVLGKLYTVILCDGFVCS